MLTALQTNYIVKDLLEKVNSIDMSAIAYKLAHQDETRNWNEFKIKDQIDLYRKFLVLTAVKADVQIVPTKEIDRVWHCHILDTIKYTADCMYIFGHYVHHFPYFGLRGEQDFEQLQASFHNTANLFENHFGINNYTSKSLTECGCADCGDGQASTVKKFTSESILADSNPLLGMYADDKARPRLV